MSGKLRIPQDSPVMEVGRINSLTGFLDCSQAMLIISMIGLLPDATVSSGRSEENTVWVTWEGSVVIKLRVSWG